MLQLLCMVSAGFEVLSSWNNILSNGMRELINFKIYSQCMWLDGISCLLCRNIAAKSGGGRYIRFLTLPAALLRFLNAPFSAKRFFGREGRLSALIHLPCHTSSVLTAGLAINLLILCRDQPPKLGINRTACKSS